jgi:hypothetical protein
LLYSTCSPNTFWQWVRLKFAFPLQYFQSNSSVSHVQCLVNLVLENKADFFSPYLIWQTKVKVLCNENNLQYITNFCF